MEEPRRYIDLFGVHCHSRKWLEGIPPEGVIPHNHVTGVGVLAGSGGVPRKRTGIFRFPQPHARTALTCSPVAVSKVRTICPLDSAMWLTVR